MKCKQTITGLGLGLRLGGFRFRAVEFIAVYPADQVEILKPLISFKNPMLPGTLLLGP